MRRSIYQLFRDLRYPPPLNHSRRSAFLPLAPAHRLGARNESTSPIPYNVIGPSIPLLPDARLANVVVCDCS